MQESTAVYAGSFDPVTLGHLWIIERSAALFSRVIVAVGVNPDKRTLFTIEERLRLLSEATSHLPGVEVDSFQYQYLVRYAAGRGAMHVVRGIRSQEDFAYEHTMRHINSDMAPRLRPYF
jgi:pantetheine-phosphate adenylyltransferase